MPFRDLPGVEQCRFKKGDCLLPAGERVEYVYYLTKGTVYRELISDKGYESILSRKNNSNAIQSLVGILALYTDIEGNIIHSGFFAHTDCIAYKIPKDVCMQYLRDHPDMMEDLLRYSLEEYVRVLKILNARREGNSTASLCKLLLERARPTEQGLLVSKKCTNVEMAKILNIHKVTVNRMLRVLKEESVLERTADGLLILQPELLRQYADDEKAFKYK